jgi:hypothetical protein
MKTFDLHIRDSLRAAYIKRWHIVNTAKEQTVGEHSFTVALMAMELVSLIKQPQWGSSVAILALEHDLDEAITGDIPASVKEDNEVRADHFSPHGIVKICDMLEAMIWIGNYHVDTHGFRIYESYRVRYHTLLDQLQGSNDPNKHLLRKGILSLVGSLTDGKYKFRYE